MAEIEVKLVGITRREKIPTGIASFDPIIRGGIPSGSVVLLLGDIGAGNDAFAYTSAAMLSLLKSDQSMLASVKGQLENFLMKEETLKLPESVCYISFTRSKEDVYREIDFAFPSEFAKALDSPKFVFSDFSSFSSISPTWDVEKEWASIKGFKDEGGLYLMRELISALEFHAPNSLVVIDSIHQLFRASGVEWRNFVSFLEDIQRKSKKWDQLIYLLLTKGMFESARELEIMDIADGVLAFEWTETGFVRHQTMYLNKFRGLLPADARENILRFDTNITKTDGFMVTNVKRISGSR